MTENPVDPKASIYAQALDTAYPGAQFTVAETGYDSLQWHSIEPPKPTEEDFNAAVSAQLAAQASPQKPGPRKRK
jgi:hypothetical protein